MNNKGQAGVVAIAGIIGVIVGVAMLPVLASLIDEAQIIQSTDEQVANTVFNESVSLSNTNIVAGSETIFNGTCSGADCRIDSPNATLRLGTEYAINYNTGVLLIINRTGTWNATYESKPTGYIDSSTGRTVAKQITLMYGVGLILLALAAAGLTLAKKS